MDASVEDIARAIYTERPAIQSWDGDPFTFDEARLRDDFEYRISIRQAQQVLNLLVQPKHAVK